jgi:hypothetical protein
MPEITIETVDVREFKSDVLVLKYAQAFHGADSAVATALSQRRDVRINPAPDEHALLPSRGMIASQHVLFVGVVRLMQFDYQEIRSFATRALLIISRELPQANHVAMTIHGAGYGLDEREAFLAQLGGIMDAVMKGASPDRITIVENNAGRAARLRTILHDAWPAPQTPLPNARRAASQAPSIAAGAESLKKPHVFVAMPFSKELEDVYVFGIQGPVNRAGYLCERVDMDSFTGEILERIKSRIETAALIVADLTGANPNVYLEVGYAWGNRKPTLLLSRRVDDLKFDVKGQRCIIYENIVDLANRLQADLAALEKR